MLCPPPAPRSKRCTWAANVLIKLLALISGYQGSRPAWTTQSAGRVRNIYLFFIFLKTMCDRCRWCLIWSARFEQSFAQSMRGERNDSNCLSRLFWGQTINPVSFNQQIKNELATLFSNRRGFHNRSGLLLDAQKKEKKKEAIYPKRCVRSCLMCVLRATRRQRPTVCVRACLLPCRWPKFPSCSQVEAIHPDCAIISQHLRAREVCSQTRRSEAQNQSDHSGAFMRGAAVSAAALCFWEAHCERFLIDRNVGSTKEKRKKKRSKKQM